MIKTAVFIISQGIGLAAASDMEDLSCKECISSGSRYCLFDNNFADGSCCSTDAKQNNSRFCQAQEQSTYCATRDSVKHPILQDFVCPATESKCPHKDDDVNIVLNSQMEFYRTYIWTEEVPNHQAIGYKCKYKVTTDPDFLKRESRIGYTFI